MEGKVLPRPGRYLLQRLLAVAAHLPRLRSEALEVAVAVEMVEERQPEEEVVGEERQAEPVLVEMVVVLWRQTPRIPPVLVGNPSVEASRQAALPVVVCMVCSRHTHLLVVV